MDGLEEAGGGGDFGILGQIGGKLVEADAKKGVIEPHFDSSNVKFMAAREGVGVQGVGNRH